MGSGIRSSIGEVVEKVAETGEEVFIPCLNEKHQNSVRTMAFAARKARPTELTEDISVSNFEEGGRLFVRVSKRPAITVYHRNENGELVPMVGLSVESAKVLKMMLESNVEEQEIVQLLTETYGEDEVVVREELERLKE